LKIKRKGNKKINNLKKKLIKERLRRLRKLRKNKDLKEKKKIR